MGCSVKGHCCVCFGVFPLVLFSSLRLSFPLFPSFPRLLSVLCSLTFLFPSDPLCSSLLLPLSLCVFLSLSRFLVLYLCSLYVFSILSVSSLLTLHIFLSFLFSSLLCSLSSVSSGIEYSRPHHCFTSQRPSSSRVAIAMTSFSVRTVTVMENENSDTESAVIC